MDQRFFNHSSTTFPAHENNGTLVLPLPPTPVLPLLVGRPLFGAVVTAYVSDAIACASRASTTINALQASSSGEGGRSAFASPVVYAARWSEGDSPPNKGATATVSECYIIRGSPNVKYDHVRQWGILFPVVLVVCPHHTIDVELIVWHAVIYT